MIIPTVAGSVPALRLWPRTWLFSFPVEISETIILSLVDQWYNVITVGLTGHSSCSPPYVACIKLWLVDDCLFFAGHMESAVYSLLLYSHWLTPATDVGTVIVLYCWSAPRHIATHWVVVSKWLQFAILSEDYCKSFLLYSASERLENWNDTELSHELNLILWRICI